MPVIVKDPMKHKGVSTPIGFFKVVSPATFIFRSLSGADRVVRGIKIGDGGMVECKFRWEIELPIEQNIDYGFP